MERSDIGWSEPINIGPPVNSDLDEYYVSLTKDGTIYFASNRAGGLGSFDIYRSRLVDGHLSLLMKAIYYLLLWIGLGDLAPATCISALVGKTAPGINLKI